MAALGREAIYSAFFALLQSQFFDTQGQPTGPFNYASRRYRPPGQLGQSQYPAFFVIEVGEDYDRSVLYAPGNVRLFAHITIQSVNGNDPNAITATELNNLADAIEDAVSASAGSTGQSTYGGLVQEAWVNGRQAQVPASSSGRWSEQVVGVEIALPRIL